MKASKTREVLRMARTQFSVIGNVRVYIHAAIGVSSQIENEACMLIHLFWYLWARSRRDIENSSFCEV